MRWRLLSSVGTCEKSEVRGRTSCLDLGPAKASDLGQALLSPQSELLSGSGVWPP